MVLRDIANTRREKTYVNKKRVYHLQDKDNIEMVWIKKESSGFKRGNRNGILSMYNIRYDLELGVGKAAARRIPCACSFCIEQLYLPWDKKEKDRSQKRYSMNRHCLNWNIFLWFK